MVPPLRRLAAGTLLSAVGNGAWYTSWALFLTRSVGLSPAQVGLGMTIAGAVGLLSATPVGWLADRLGARGLRRPAGRPSGRRARLPRRARPTHVHRDRLCRGGGAHERRRPQRARA